MFRQHKMLLPTYDVFDEARHFVPAESQSVCEIGGRQAALTICEDAWNDKEFWQHRLYQRDPVEELAQDGAKMLLSINASPYHMGKRELRREIFAATARRVQRAGGLRQPGRRKRSTCVRRQQLRHGCRGAT